uniref:Uncharacterized protein n=1 Tax=Anopheles christyi TaxID=43041 RepID=A0A182KJ33_9DIPT
MGFVACASSFFFCSTALELSLSPAHQLRLQPGRVVGLCHPSVTIKYLTVVPVAIQRAVTAAACLLLLWCNPVGSSTPTGRRTSVIV